ncbi:MAG TPA: DMT family transporter [Rhizobacter sp.]|nr:DMT family transporter [Rhizobacter sp.]
MTSPALTPRVILLLTLPPLLWAGNAVVGRSLVGIVPPLALSAMRWAVALLILLPLGWRLFQRPQDIRRRLPYLALLGFLGVGSFNGLQYLALQTSTPLNVALIISSMPLWMLGLGALLYGEHPTRRQVLGALLSLVGVVLVVSRGQLEVLLALHLLPGDLLMLLALALWAWYSWLLARPPAHMQGEARPPWGWAEMLLVQVLFGAAFAGAAAGVEAVVHPAPIQWSMGVLAALAYVAIGPSVLAYRFWGEGVATVGPAIAAFFNNLTPIFAALLSAAWLGESPRWYHVIAFVFIAAGILVTSRPAKA